MDQKVSQTLNMQDAEQIWFDKLLNNIEVNMQHIRKALFAEHYTPAFINLYLKKKETHLDELLKIQKGIQDGQLVQTELLKKGLEPTYPSHFVLEQRELCRQHIRDYRSLECQETYVWKCEKIDMHFATALGMLKIAQAYYIAKQMKQSNVDDQNPFPMHELIERLLCVAEVAIQDGKRNLVCLQSGNRLYRGWGVLTDQSDPIFGAIAEQLDQRRKLLNIHKHWETAHVHLTNPLEPFYQKEPPDIIKKILLERRNDYVDWKFRENKKDGQCLWIANCYSKVNRHFARAYMCLKLVQDYQLAKQQIAKEKDEHQ